mgnify:CR=1 FL=1
MSNNNTTTNNTTKKLKTIHHSVATCELVVMENEDEALWRSLLGDNFDEMQSVIKSQSKRIDHSSSGSTTTKLPNQSILSATSSSLSSVPNIASFLKPKVNSKDSYTITFDVPKGLAEQMRSRQARDMHLTQMKKQKQKKSKNKKKNRSEEENGDDDDDDCTPFSSPDTNPNIHLQMDYTNEDELAADHEQQEAKESTIEKENNNNTTLDSWEDWSTNLDALSTAQTEMDTALQKAASGHEIMAKLLPSSDAIPVLLVNFAILQADATSSEIKDKEEKGNRKNQSVDDHDFLIFCSVCIPLFLHIPQRMYKILYRGD